MGRRRPERDKAKELWEKSYGKKSIKELAQELGVSESQLRKWKSQDKWVAKKPRGAPKGNQNAAGHKGPAEKSGLGNKNAQTHGAYAKPDENSFTEEERKTVDQIRDGMLRDLVKKYYDLQHKIEAIESDESQFKYFTGGIDGTNMVEYWDSKDKWLETLEQRSIKILGRIQKFFDQQQARESLESHERLTLAGLKFQREKAMGVFDDDADDSADEGNETEEAPED